MTKTQFDSELCTLLEKYNSQNECTIKEVTFDTVDLRSVSYKKNLDVSTGYNNIKLEIT